MDSPGGRESSTRATLIVLGSIVFAALLSFLLVGLVPRPHPGATPTAKPYRETQPAQPAVAEVGRRPVSASNGRVVPAEVAASAEARPHWTQPGLTLVTVQRAPRWQDARAQIRDVKTNDVRAYAIGDLLPHGSLLVGISTVSVEILVADTVLVQLQADSSDVVPVDDFRTADEGARLKTARDLSHNYVQAIEDALAQLASSDDHTAQDHIDELIACGDPAVEVLIPWVVDDTPVQVRRYRFPSGSEKELEVRVVGDVVVGVLERITGETFGRLDRAESDSARQAIRRSWTSWWGSGELETDR